jgi:hypothetical protein
VDGATVRPSSPVTGRELLREDQEEENMWFAEGRVRVVGSIPRVGNMSVESFNRHVADNRAVIIPGALAGSKALSWTDESLKSTVGDEDCRIYVSRDGDFPGGEGQYDETRYQFRKIKLAEALDRMSEREQLAPLCWPGEHYYLYALPPKIFRSIEHEVVLPTFLSRQRAHLDRAYWISHRGDITPPHLDFCEGVLFQLRGRKRVLLWGPSQYANLYINRIGTAQARQSQVDLAAPDFDRFPLLEQATAVEGFIEPGDALFIPFGHIHAIYSDSASMSMNTTWGKNLSHLLRRTVTGPLAGYCLRSSPIAVIKQALKAT